MLTNHSVRKWSDWTTMCVVFPDRLVTTLVMLYRHGGKIAIVDHHYLFCFKKCISCEQTVLRLTLATAGLGTVLHGSTTVLQTLCLSVALVTMIPAGIIATKCTANSQRVNISPITICLQGFCVHMVFVSIFCFWDICSKKLRVFYNVIETASKKLRTPLAVSSAFDHGDSCSQRVTFQLMWREQCKYAWYVRYTCMFPLVVDYLFGVYLFVSVTGSHIYTFMLYTVNIIQDFSRPRYIVQQLSVQYV